MSLRLVLAVAVLALDARALDRLWRPAARRPGRLRWTAAILLLPVLGALLSLLRGAESATNGGIQ